MNTASRLLSWGLLKDRPSVELLVCPLPVARGQQDTNLPTRSVLAVLPGFDGLRHTRPCGFVAPRYRPWGSPGFQPSHDVAAKIPTFLTGAQALRSFPLSSSGFPVTRALPSRRCLHTHRSVRFNPTSGVCSTGESVAAPTCCHVGPPEAPLGFPTISGSHHCLGISSDTLPTTEVTSCSTTEAVVRRGGLPAPHSCE